MTDIMKAMQHVDPYRGQDNHNRGRSYWQQVPSLTESSLARYGDGNSKPTQPTIETCTHPKTRLQHPLLKDNNYLSDYPVRLRGCFNCGKTDHWRCNECPSRKAGYFNKTRFLMTFGLINHILRQETTMELQEV